MVAVKQLKFLQEWSCKGGFAYISVLDDTAGLPLLFLISNDQSTLSSTARTSFSPIHCLFSWMNLWWLSKVSYLATLESLMSREWFQVLDGFLTLLECWPRCREQLVISFVFLDVVLHPLWIFYSSRCQIEQTQELGQLWELASRRRASPLSFVKCSTWDSLWTPKCICTYSCKLNLPTKQHTNLSSLGGTSSARPHWQPTICAILTIWWFNVWSTIRAWQGLPLCIFFSTLTHTCEHHTLTGMGPGFTTGIYRWSSITTPVFWLQMVTTWT